MHASFKVYLLTGTFCKGNGQLCQYNLAKFLFSIFLTLNFFHLKKKNVWLIGWEQVQRMPVQIPIYANRSAKYSRNRAAEELIILIS